MINLPDHCHTSVHPNRTTTHTWTTKHGTWTITRNDKTTAITGPGTIIRLETATDERINALLVLFGAIGGGQIDPLAARLGPVYGVDPAAKPGDEPIVVTRAAAGYMWRDQPKVMADKLHRWEPKPRPPADRCTCVGECRNCRADKLAEAFASWYEFEPYLIGGIKAHLVDWRIDWHAPKATLVDPFDELCADIATVMARYIRDTFDLDSLEKRDWNPDPKDPTAVDEFFTARDHPVRVRRSDAYDPPGAWLSTTRSNYGAHMSVDEVKRVINALARAAGIPYLAEYTPGEFVPGDPSKLRWAAPLQETSRSQESGWVRLTLPSSGLDLAACPDRMNLLSHDGHSWADSTNDGALRKIWWCFGYQPDTLTAEPKEEPQ